MSAVFYSIAGAPTTFELSNNNRDLVYITTTTTFDTLCAYDTNSSTSVYVTVEADDPLDVNWQIKTLCL